jgi:hypothetical protein
MNIQASILPAPIRWADPRIASEGLVASIVSSAPHRPHPLTHAGIDAAVTATSAGTYALGYLDGAELRVFYVGRSDDDLNRRLHDWVDVPSRARRHVSPAKAAWDVRPRGRFASAPTLARVGVGADTPYTCFVFRYASSPGVAFERECRDYERFGGSEQLDNPFAPAPPEAESAHLARP